MDLLPASAEVEEAQAEAGPTPTVSGPTPTASGPTPTASGPTRGLPTFELTTRHTAGLAVCIVAVVVFLVWSGSKGTDDLESLLHHATEQVCDTLGDTTPGCMFAQAIAEGLPAGRCSGVVGMLNQLHDQLGDYQQHVADAEHVFVTLYLAQCPGGARPEHLSRPGGQAR